MKANPHELFPDGDAALIISLRRPNEQTIFGPEAMMQLELLERRQNSTGERQMSDEPQPGDGPAQADEELEPDVEPAPQPEFDSEAGPEAEPVLEVDFEPEVEPEPTTEPQIDVESDLAHESTDGPIEERPAIQMRVSSQHLILASPVFRQMLKGPWKEGITSTASSSHISMSEWDAKAFMILLDIIHGHHWDVPKSLGLEMLTKFAVIVDYYQCYEIVDVFVDRWLREMERDLPTCHGKTSVMWLCVSWVFSRSETFHATAKLALKHQEGPIGFMNLPIAPILGW